nr:RNA-dependent RNA polymerase [Picobirnavirus sp.]AVD97020.1 RNA-dependent RNA polymerase [Picobirnavirus sp.]
MNYQLNPQRVPMSAYFSDVKLARTKIGAILGGYPVVLESPTMYGSKDITEVLKEWNHTLSKLKKTMPGLYSFEEELGEKVGPRSYKVPFAERLDDLAAYYEYYESSVNATAISEVAIKRALKRWNGRKLRMSDQSNTLTQMKLSTSSGSPYLAKRKDCINETVPCTVYQDGKFTRIILPNFDGNTCAIPGWRGQEGGLDLEDVKQRIIAMMPFSVNVCEHQVYKPLTKAAQSAGIRAPWISLSEVDRRMTMLFDTKSSDDLVICTDFSKFDQHFGKPCQEAAEYYLNELFASTDQFRTWLKNVFPIKYHIPFLTSYGYVQFGRHGMASGSGGTSADETNVHESLQEEAALNSGTVLNKYSMALGDDGVLSFPGITVDKVLRSYTAHGLEMNESKQYVSTTEATFLRRYYSSSYRPDGIMRGVYSTNRAIGKVRYMERWVDEKKLDAAQISKPEYYVLRELSILQNLEWHPLRFEFAEFCIKGDHEWGLGTLIPGFFEKIEKTAQRLSAVMPDWVGYNQSEMSKSTGIQDWWIVQYLLKR